MNEPPPDDVPAEAPGPLIDPSTKAPASGEKESNDPAGLSPISDLDASGDEALEIESPILGPEQPDEQAGIEGADSLGPRPQRPLDPPKLVRLANLAREVLEEVRQMTPQDSTVQDLAGLYRRVENQLKDALPEPLAEELEAMNLDMPFRDGASQDEVRIALAGLIGWLGGLFQGLHASLLAAAPVLELPPEAGPPGAMLPGAGPNSRPGLRPAARPISPEERKGEGYL